MNRTCALCGHPIDFDASYVRSNFRDAYYCGPPLWADCEKRRGIVKPEKPEMLEHKREVVA